MTLDGSLPEAMVIGLIEDSYDLVVDGLRKADRDRVRAAEPAGSSRRA